MKTAFALALLMGAMFAFAGYHAEQAAQSQAPAMRAHFQAIDHAGE